MRIALISNSFFPRVGGAEFVVHNLASAWQRRGHDVCVFTSMKDGDFPVPIEYNVQNYNKPRWYCGFSPHSLPFQIYAGQNILSKIRRFQPDFISAHSGYPLGVWLSKIKKLPKYLITCHGRELTKFPWGSRAKYKVDDVLATALNCSGGAVAISRHARELMEEIGVSPDKILDIPNGVDIHRFRKQVPFDFRGEFNLPQDALVILSVGREHPQKAYDAGICAFSKISKIPNLFYVLLGRGTSKWASLVGELGLANRVILCEGMQGDNLVAAYQQADIFLSSSVWEMMPLVVLEAMAAGLPLVVTNVSGSQDLVVSGENGVIIDPGNINGMAETLTELIANENMRKRMASSSLVKSEIYSWDNISQKYLQAYFSQ